MCGINGFNFKDEELIGRMVKRTAHRGPDASGVYIDENVSLGHNRLSIIDLSEAANQPMKSNDGNYIIVYNGELYNFKELRKELEGGYVFKTSGDTEVVLAAYIKWGNECVKRFNGIFAFAIWNKMKKELFVARDQSGVKPFYYFWDNKKFIFSSEIKGILEHPIERVLNRDSFYAYFRLLYVPGPKSIFKDIYKLPIGHYGMLKDNKYELYDYREEISKEVLNLSGKDLEEKVKEEVFNAVKRQMVSDKPVGVFLSGGIDSSSVLACASKLNSKIKTFSSGFDLGDKHLNDKYNLDLQNAGKTARYFGSDHYEIIMKNSEALGILKKMIYHADEPAANATFLSTFYLAEFAKKQVDVVLTGDGGDEIFGGYNRYRMCMAGEYYHYLPSFLRKLLNKHEELKKLNINSGLDLAMQFFYQKRSRFDQVLKNEPDSYNYVKKFFSENLADERGFRTLTEQYMDLESKTWLVYESHLRGDKMTMAHGLEARLPFTDRELIKLAHQIKRKYKVGFFDSKIILKRAFKNDFPEFLTKQPKTGWLSPFKAWVRSNEFELKIKETLTPSFNDKTSELINWKELNSLLKDFSIDSRMFLWSILVFQIWAKEYKIKTF